MRRTYWMSVEQLATLIAALMLASCVRVQAQFGVEQPMFAMTSAVTPQTLLPDGALQYHWTYTNWANGALNTWTDRIQNFAISKAVNAPTNTTSGLFFYKTMYQFTNTPLAMSTNQVTAFIIKPIENSDQDYHVFAATTNWSARNLKFYTPLDRTLGKIQYGVVDWSSEFRITNEVDCVFSVIYTNVIVYTNGVLCTTNIIPGTERDCFQWTHFGGDSVPGSANNQLWLRGWIREIMVYTNINDWSLWASNYHFYRTNTYGP